MTEQTDPQARIAELERQVFQLRSRVAALEAVQPHMATKAEMIASRGIFNFHFGKRKSKDAGSAHWIDSNFNFLLLILIPPMLILLITLLLLPLIF